MRFHMTPTLTAFSWERNRPLFVISLTVASNNEIRVVGKVGFDKIGPPVRVWLFTCIALWGEASMGTDTSPTSLIVHLWNLVDFTLHWTKEVARWTEGVDTRLARSRDEFQLTVASCWCNLDWNSSSCVGEPPQLALGSSSPYVIEM
jgi:hypothetical protein